MNPDNQTAEAPLRSLIVVRPEPAGLFTAQAVGLPEIHATAASREEAIRQVHLVLANWLAEGQLVPIELPPPNPLLKWFGHAKDDPDFDLYLEEIRRYREEVDQREGQQPGDGNPCSDSSSIPTT